jgi:putative restriction endonuclease
LTPPPPLRYRRATVVRGYVANTDYDWYRFLAAERDLDEVNFWFPKYTGAFRAAPDGRPAA